MILSYLSTITVDSYKPPFKFNPSPRPVDTICDWLRVTNTRISEFHDFMGTYGPLLRSVGLSFHDTGGGLNGYTNAWAIKFNDENCGFICADALNKMGGMLDLSGKACQLLQGRWDLWCYLLAGMCTHGFAITRLDVACDFKGSLWDSYGKNMLDISSLVSGGIHNPKVGSKPSVSLVGSWLDVVVGKLDGDSYVPKEMCSGGLTINVGKASSVNKWVWYEKGKQLLGMNPDRFDGSLDSWVRCERRFGRGTGRSKVVIPFDFALYPDDAFIYQCEGVSNFLRDWKSFKADNGVEVLQNESVESVDLELVKTFKYTSLKKTAIHVAAQSARFLRTLISLGIDPMDFFDRVVSDSEVRGFDPYFHSSFSLDDCFPEVV